MNFNENLKNYRLSRKMSQKDFAIMLGISKSYMSELESGKRKPSVETVDNISKKLGVSTVYLLEGKMTFSDMQNLPVKDKRFELYQMFEGMDNEIKEDARNGILEYLNNFPSYTKDEHWTVRNTFELIHFMKAQNEEKPDAKITKETIESRKIRNEQTVDFASALLQDLKIKLEDYPDINLDSYYRKTLDELSKQK